MRKKEVCNMKKTYNVPAEYTPISMWGYFGYSILFSIPVVGFIFICVFALGGTKNVNKKNYARSYFCTLILALIIIGLIVLVAALTGGTAAAVEALRSVFNK